MSDRTTMRGFTIIEMLAVMAIIAILVAIAVPAYMAVQKSSMKQTARSELESMKVGLASLRNDFGALPPSDDSPMGLYLKSLPETDVYRNGRVLHRAGAPYAEIPAKRMVRAGTSFDFSTLPAGLWSQLEDSSGNALVLSDYYQFRDPFGNPYRYVVTTDGYRLYSFGPDGADDSGTDDDIVIEVGQ